MIHRNLSMILPKIQICKMLRIEGNTYTSITTALILTAGSGVLYGEFQIVKAQASYAVFTWPVLQIVAALVIVVMICNLIPIFVYKTGTALYQDFLLSKGRYKIKLLSVIQAATHLSASSLQKPVIPSLPQFLLWSVFLFPAYASPPPFSRKLQVLP